MAAMLLAFGYVTFTSGTRTCRREKSHFVKDVLDRYQRVVPILRERKNLSAFYQEDITLLRK